MRELLLLLLLLLLVWSVSSHVHISGIIWHNILARRNDGSRESPLIRSHIVVDEHSAAVHSGVINASIVYRGYKIWWIALLRVIISVWRIHR